MELPTNGNSPDSGPDDEFSMICGDLGLGQNSRSSAAVRYELQVSSSDTGTGPITVTQGTFSRQQKTQDGVNRDRNDFQCLDEHSGEVKTLSNKTPRTTSTSSSRKSKKNALSRLKSSDSTCHSQDNVESVEHFPTYADVPYGTSLRQQKKLFEQNISSFRKKKGSCSADAEKELDGMCM
jgi:hypothetical protein